MNYSKYPTLLEMCACVRINRLMSICTFHHLEVKKYSYHRLVVFDFSNKQYQYHHNGVIMKKMNDLE